MVAVIKVLMVDVLLLRWLLFNRLGRELLLLLQLLLLLHLLLLGDLLGEGANLILHLEEYGLVGFSLLRVVLLHQIKPFIELVFRSADLFKLAF